LNAPAPKDLNACYARNFNDFPRELFERCFPETPWWPEGTTLSGLAFAPDDLIDWLRHTEFSAYLPFILLKTDRASMFHSLEVRVPFLDREVIDVALSIDPMVFVAPSTGIGKKPLRSILRQLTGIETAGKRGFTVPVDDWIRGPLRDCVMTSLDRLAGLDDFPVNRAAVCQLVADHMDGRCNVGTGIWRFLVLDLWWDRCRGRVNDA
jgi:asparagine synthase (glutamine-hydrolysing)